MNWNYWAKCLWQNQPPIHGITYENGLYGLSLGTMSHGKNSKGQLQNPTAGWPAVPSGSGRLSLFRTIETGRNRTEPPVNRRLGLKPSPKVQNFSQTDAQYLTSKYVHVHFGSLSWDGTGCGPSFCYQHESCTHNYENTLCKCIRMSQYYQRSYIHFRRKTEIGLTHVSYEPTTSSMAHTHRGTVQFKPNLVE